MPKKAHSCNLERPENKHDLPWLRISMSCHKFSNLRESFQGDPNKKIMIGVMSKDFMDLECNCNKKTKINGTCPYNGECRKSCLIYGLTCKACEIKPKYLGSTQQHLKERTNQHCDDVRYLVKSGKKSDSFASHFAQHFNKGDSVSRSEVRKLLDVEIIWQGKPISCMKTFGKNTCSLCMRERCCILDACNENPKKLINSKSEIYGGCQHRTRFHRLVRNNTTSTDDGAKPEKVSASTTATTIANKLSKAAGKIRHAAGTVVGF